MKNKKWVPLYVFSCSLLMVIFLELPRIGNNKNRSFYRINNENRSFHRINNENRSFYGIDKSVTHTLVDGTAVPIAAYFDARPLHSHNNSVVIFVAVLNKYVKSIKGCEVDGRRETYKIKTTPIAVTWWIHKVHRTTHTEIILSCFDMPAKHNSSVSMLFDLSGHVFSVPVRRPGVLMPSKGKEKDGVMVCCTGYRTPDNLDEWLIYQQSIKVQFIHLNAHESFVQNVNKSKTLNRLLESGYVQMEVWPQYLDEKQVYRYSQSFKYQDCIYRYQNIYKYMMIIDFDEYFIPLTPGKKDVHYYAEKLLTGRNCGSVELPSIRYYCKVKAHENMSLPADGNLTVIYDTSYFSHMKSGEGKSIHIVKFVEEVSVHVSAHLLPCNTQVTHSEPNKARCYIFHVTRYPSYTNQCPH